MKVKVIAKIPVSPFSERHPILWVSKDNLPFRPGFASMYGFKEPEPMLDEFGKPITAGCPPIGYEEREIEIDDEMEYVDEEGFLMRKGGKDNG